MKKIILMAALLVSSSSMAQNKLLVAGSGWNKVVVMDMETEKVEWSYTLRDGEECNHVERTRAGDVLLSSRGGARLVSGDQQIVWEFKVGNQEGVQTATELRSGEYMLAICGYPARIVTLNRNGEMIREIKFETGITGLHNQFRQVAPTKRGTYIIPFMGTGEVIEMSATGEKIRGVQVGGNLFSAKELKNGNWLVACGDAHKLMTIDPNSGARLDSICNNTVSPHELLFVAEPAFLPNGNLLIANWDGHSANKSQPKIIVLDRKKQVVDTLGYSKEIGRISSIHVERKKHTKR